MIINRPLVLTYRPLVPTISTDCHSQPSFPLTADQSSIQWAIQQA
ncbi:MAG: hypothetical protein AAGL08_06735 [Cyanobacteria bacterium J06573_11]